MIRETRNDLSNSRASRSDGRDVQRHLEALVGLALDHRTHHHSRRSEDLDLLCGKREPEVLDEFDDDGLLLDYAGCMRERVSEGKLDAWCAAYANRQLSRDTSGWVNSRDTAGDVTYPIQLRTPAACVYAIRMHPT